MNVADSIRTTLASVIDTLGDSSPWEYRKLTSKFGAEPRTYGDWLEITALPTRGAHSESFDADRAAFKRIEGQAIRVKETEPTLTQGDQVRDPSGIVWAVLGKLSSAYGTVAYSLERETPLVGSVDRKGGL